MQRKKKVTLDRRSRQTDWREKTKTLNNEMKSKQRQIGGETDKRRNYLIYHMKLKERTGNILSISNDI